MCPTTTPNDSFDPDNRTSTGNDADDFRLLRGRYAHPRPKGQITAYIDPASGRDDTVRLIQTTDELLGQVLRRPGQLFVVSHGLRATGRGTELQQWTYIEFADGDKVEVRYAR